MFVWNGVWTKPSREQYRAFDSGGTVGMSSDMPDGVIAEELVAEVRRQLLYRFIEQVLIGSGLLVVMALVCVPFVVVGWMSAIAVVFLVGAGAGIFIIGLVVAVLQSHLLAGGTVGY